MLASLCKLSFISHNNKDIADLFGNNILTPRDYVLIIVLEKEREQQVEMGWKPPRLISGT